MPLCFRCPSLRSSFSAPSLLLCAALAWPALSAAEGATDLEVYLAGIQDPAAADQARDTLLKGDMKALVTALAARYKDEHTDSNTRMRIIALLGTVKSDDSAAMLQKICAQSPLTVMDVADWPALVRAVQAGATAAEGDFSARIWQRLSAAERKGVEQLAAATEAIGSPNSQELALLTALNHILDDVTVCTEADIAGGLPGEAQALANRWRNRNRTDLPPEARFTASEYRQLNNDLLHQWLDATLQSKLDIPAQMYEARMANAAIAELMSMAGQPVAEAAIIGLNPDPFQARQHIQALGTIHSTAATERLYQYLRSDAAAASNLSRDLLKTRMDNDATTIETLILNTISAYGFTDVQPAPLSTTVCRNLMQVTLTLPSEASRRNILERCLGLTDNPLRDAAFVALKDDPKLVRFEDIRKAIAARLEQDTSADCALQTLAILQVSEDADSVPMVAGELNHESRDVRVQAARALEMLTGKHLGANPTAWKKWYAETHPDAEPAPAAEVQ